LVLKRHLAIHEEILLEEGKKKREETIRGIDRSNKRALTSTDLFGVWTWIPPQVRSVTHLVYHAL